MEKFWTPLLESPHVNSFISADLFMSTEFFMQHKHATCNWQQHAAGRPKGGTLFCMPLHFLSSKATWSEIDWKQKQRAYACHVFFVFSITNCNNKKIILQVDPAWTIPYSRPYPIRISTAMNNPIRVSLPTWRRDARVSSIRFVSARLIHFLDIFSGWHYCDIDGRQASFLCPNGTQFSQAVFVCDWWFNVRCDLSPRLYAINARLYQRPKVNPTRPHRIITKQLVEDIFTWSAQLSVSIYI